MKRSGQRYRSIASDLRDRILRGDFTASTRLPTEEKLASRYGVSRITMRRALSILAEERLVVRRQGSGTFIGPRRTRRIPLMIDYTGSMRTHAPSLERSVITWKWTEAGESVAERLGIQRTDMVLAAERIDTLKGVPVAWDQASIVRSYGEGLTEKHLARIDFVEVWEKVAGFRIESCSQVIEAELASPRTCARLGLKARQPVLKATEVFLAYRKRPVAVFVSYYNPAHIVISSSFHWTRLHEEA
jgi:GntR family transcriptional regulator